MSQPPPNSPSPHPATSPSLRPATSSSPPPPTTRFHPSQWPLAVWVVLALLAEALRVDYTLGAFSFAPAVALLAGTWLGPRRGALSQAIAVGCLAIIAVFVPATAAANEWGFHIGRVLTAWVAGQVAPADERGAHPPLRVRLVVLSAAVTTVALIIMTSGATSGVPIGNSPLGGLFVVAFLVAPAFVVFYAWRIVPEPARVIGYAYSLMPYYALGLAWPWAFNRFGGMAAGSLASDQELVFHGYLAHVPGDVIGIVLISYIVCAVNRAAYSDAPPTNPEPPAAKSGAPSN